jgi:NTP pyrophosphatase (non-canonical NTP hydrolase)
MAEISELMKKIKQFNSDRDWDQFHNPKDLAISLVLEAAEVLEHFQWKNGEEIAARVESKKTEITEEVADVAIYLLNLCNKLDIDLANAIESKLTKSAQKYPIDKAKGRSDKYTEL